MKSTLVIFILIPVLLFGQDEVEKTSLMKISLFGGASLPQGDFSSTNGDKAGFSKTGFCFILEGSKHLNPEVSWTTTVSLSMNSMDEAEMQKQAGGFTVSAGSYVTTWGMTGLKFNAPTSENASIYAMGQAGILFSSFPDISLSYGGVTVTQTAKLATAFAFGFGGGFQTDKVNIGLRYYTGEPEYEQSASGGGISGSATVKLPATILQLVFGVNL